ncbi:D-alanyl-D-alanine carboxypeptidase (penicillin-binding protein 5/6) [Cryobacterium flavum]|uniref:D-alanyl-D-alanine carboxypeptidase (Penicillin-binding protein 5/6) n=1 Tax=Cryobacterium flavum TaxID=1424659 RepID=A0A4V3IAU0_9MICO|nr:MULTISPECIES: hypothetical protein [Cryobacterium]TFB82150.1 hypothetical protein E3O21_00370 [Cryobacterium flavum]SDN89391.1 D-alanyl-D-alanine carboxypeptidase (penicillin-binding protein 5/6) [Cryobacterium flavum]
MSSFRPGRLVGILVGTVVILGFGVYGPATLLGPLPPVTAFTVTPAATATAPTPPVLPANGASAITVLAATTSDASGTTSTRAEGSQPSAPIAVAGTAEALPLASIAKVVTALVVLDAKPIVAGESGPIVTLTAADFQSYLDYDKAGARSVAVFADEQWAELELLQALLLGSSNNHADTVARWAFGSVDAYVVAANAWLSDNGLTGTSVVDATGLHDASAGTATDLAHLAGLAATDPIVSSMLASPATALANRRGVQNTTSYLPEEGITGVSRSYTDAAGVCFLFTATVSDGASSFTFSGAFIGEPTYDALTADLTALMASARAGVGPLPVLAAGDAYATFESAWGDEASAVVGVSRTRYAWQATTPEAATVELKDFATARTGANVGQVRLTVAGEKLSAALKLDQGIADPGPGWRLLHPIVMITALLDQ